MDSGDAGMQKVVDLILILDSNKNHIHETKNNIRIDV